jgi:cell division protein FtsL
MRQTTASVSEGAAERAAAAEAARLAKEREEQEAEWAVLQAARKARTTANSVLGL